MIIGINRDRAFGVTMLVLSATYYLAASGIPESQLADAVGPQGLPKTYAALLAALALVLIVRSGRGVGAPASDSGRPALWRVAGMLAIGAVYIAVVPWLGYVVSLAGLIFTTTYYQGGSVNRQVAIVAVSGAVFCWVLFVLVMGIPQPPGLWPSLL